MPAYTLLSISGISIPDNAVRAATMTLAPIDEQGQLARDVNGTMRDWSSSQFQKYRATISCTDFAAPDFTGIWRGLEVEVTCIEGIGATNETDDTLNLTMIVMDWQNSRDDWSKDTSWSIDLQEK